MSFGDKKLSEIAVMAIVKIVQWVWQLNYAMSMRI